MRKCTDGRDTLTRIALLRARAALEREMLVRDAVRFSHTLSPSHWVKRGVSKLGLRGGSWLTWQLFTHFWHYIPLFSTVSARLLRGKTASRLKLAVFGFAAWQIYQHWRTRQCREK